MVEPIKQTVTVIDNIEWQLLILGITLLVFVTVIFYFTRYYYKKNYYVTQEFDQQTNQNKSKITPGSILPCKRKGDCLVDLATGLKTCPSNNTLMYYDITTQVCAPKNGCPTILPYAINGDGSVNKFGTCEGDTACSCTDQVTCPRYVTSKFSVTNGNIYSSYGSEKNFLFEQIPYNANDSYDGSIKIDSSGEFCKINSTYSSTLVGGCSFLNQTNDFLMKCDSEDLSSSKSVSPYSLDPYYLSSSSTTETQFCEVQPYLDSNWNNMTLCVNQNPCKIGNYTYNYDKINPTTKIIDSREFCQSSSSSLDTYLTDLQYYTLSCINGTRCNTLPNITDVSKFFVGENSELDISAINASYSVNYNNNTLSPNINTENVTTKANYNPFINKLKSGDIVYDSTNTKWYIMRVVDQNHVTFYTFNSDNEYSKTDLENDPNLTYYPQYALNGFNYNTITSPTRGDLQVRDLKLIASIDFYKIGNISNSSVPSNPGNGYNPSYDILTNQTFYRAGLSAPRGYVFKEFEQEVATQEDITETYNQTSFNVSNYKIKQTPFNTTYYDDISLYNPVWNNQYNRTECIRCSPLLVASINMVQTDSQGSASGFICDAVTIQFSGQDFGHYRKNFQTSDSTKRWCYESRSKVNNAVISSPNKIYLDRPNVNIKVGDYILSNTSEFNFKMIPTETLPSSMKGKTFYIFMGEVRNRVRSGGNEPYNFTPFYDTKLADDDKTKKVFLGLGQDNNTYQDFIKDQFITTQYNGSEFILNDTVSITDTTGFFFGNVFTAILKDSIPITPTLNHIPQDLSIDTSNYFSCTIVPSVQVKSISPNDAIITTTGYTANSVFSKSTININSTLQFISLDRNLYLNNTSDINKNLPGSGGVIELEEITDGRITSIKVTESGTGYSNISPLVRIESYEAYIN